MNTLLGVLAGYALRRFPQRAALYLLIAGVTLFVAGLALNPAFVINKRLWTSSFALLSSGFSAVLFAGLLWLLKFQMVDRILTPLKVLGVNAILVFTLSIQNLANTFALGFIPDPYVASLAMLGLITALVWPLYRRSIFLRL